MLKLRRGTVVATDPLTVEVGDERRAAWADQELVGEVEVGDEVIVNTEACDLGLGSGGFDLVHANLSRGLDRGDADGVHVMKLNYTSLQHPVDPVEVDESGDRSGSEAARCRDLAARTPGTGGVGGGAGATRPAGRLRPGGRRGARGGALARRRRAARARAALRRDHRRTGVRGEHEAISLPGALDAAARRLGWDAIVVGPGPGIVGSATRLGHGGMAALDGAHAALALGLPTLLCPRLSSSDERARHRGLSHHSASVLELLLAPVRVPVPEAELEGWPLLAEQAPEGGSAQAALDDLIEICTGRHDLAVEPVDLDGYAASGLPATTMGRPLADDPLFFAAPLASGRALAAAANG